MKNLHPFRKSSADDDSAQSVASTGAESFVEVMDVEPRATDAQAATLTVALNPRFDNVGVDAKLTMTEICATVTACDLPEDDDSRAPVDIVVALDVSGSMSGNKLGLCKKTLELLLRELRPQDRFGLVTFDDEARLDISGRKLTTEGKAAALRTVKNLRTRGCTNISGGIGMAAQEMRAIENPNGVRTILLLTDGHANRGVSHHEGIVELTKGCLAMQSGDAAPVTIHTFGYGSDHDAKLLRGISQATPGGSYYFVEDDSNVSSAFGDALGGILSVVAQNAELTIRVPESASQAGVQILDVHHDAKTRQEDGSFKVSLGDFYAEESRDVVFKVTLAAGSDASLADHPAVPHASVSLGYTDTLKKRLGSQRGSVSIARPAGAEVSAANRHVVVQWLRVRATQAMTEAQQTSRNGNLEAARAKIKSCLEEIRKETTEGVQSEPLIVQLVTELNEVLSGLASRAEYARQGEMYLETRQQCHSAQRCSEATAFSSNVYRGKNKSFLSKKWTLPK